MKTEKIWVSRAMLFIGIVCVVLAFFIVYRSSAQIRVAPKPVPARYEVDVAYIETWMTLPYIGHIYQVPSLALFEALNIDPVVPRNHNRNLSSLARTKGLDPQVFLQEVKNAVSFLRVNK